MLKLFIVTYKQQGKLGMLQERKQKKTKQVKLNWFSKFNIL